MWRSSILLKVRRTPILRDLPRSSRTGCGATSCLPQKIPSRSFLFLHKLSPINCCTKRDCVLEQWVWRGHTLYLTMPVWTTLKAVLTCFPTAKDPSRLLTEEQKSPCSHNPLFKLVAYPKTWLKHFVLQTQTFINQSCEKVPCSCDF